MEYSYQVSPPSDLKQVSIRRKNKKGTTFIMFSSQPPCIMCVQYIGGCPVHRGVFSTPGDIMSTSRGSHEYIGGYHDECGDTMSTSGDVQYIGGIP